MARKTILKAVSAYRAGVSSPKPQRVGDGHFPKSDRRSNFWWRRAPCSSPISVGSKNRVKNRTSFQDTFALDRLSSSYCAILKSAAVPITTIHRRPDQAEDVGNRYGGWSEKNGQRQITPPAVRSDDEVHQLGKSQRCVPTCSPESDASPGRPYLRTDAIESRDNSPLLWRWPLCGPRMRDELLKTHRATSDTT